MITEPTFSLTEDAEALTPASGALRAEVQEVVRGLGKALRTYQLYAGSGPAVDRFFEALTARFAALWSRTDRVVVEVDEHDLLWEGSSVYQGEDRGEDLAFLLYRDGIREIVLLPGFEAEGELQAFVELLARVHRARTDQEDLLTLLWERDWVGLRYHYVEPMNEGVQVPLPSGKAPRPVPEPREEASTVVSSVSRDDFQESLYFLDADELRRLEQELEAEMRRDVWGDVANCLLDRLQDGDAERQERIAGILTDLLPTLLAARRLDGAAYLLRELVGVATGEARLSPAALRALRGLFEQLGRAETVEELVRIVEEGGESVAPASLAELFGFFPPDALGPLLRAAEKVSVPEVRSTVTAAAERLAAQSHAHLAGLVASPDASVAAGATRLVGRLGVSAAIGPVAGLLARPEAALRVVAVEALQELRSPASLDAALDDADREVRVAAVRALAALRFSPARPRLEAALESKRLREAELTERIAFFEAYGTIAGADAIPLLERVLNGKSWLGRRETGEMRACAALGLGRIRHPAAEKALSAAAADPEPVVRSAVGRALRAQKP